ncbi:hypothetical protein CKF58_08245 [Psittacicella hinzii]|uniref:Uncharacterized protein n=1 Tax=Psittacicella hinzii TaxID=2028575 RepID=A0A3A1YAW8_9GAMM|nr:hypothetical protein CKF58_08245 [Psittacicella hinzii]
MLGLLPTQTLDIAGVLYSLKPNYHYLGFWFLVKVFLSVAVISLFFTLLIRIFNVEVKQILLRYRKDPEKLNETNNFASRFNFTLACKFAQKLCKYKFGKTYLRTFIGLLLASYTSIFLASPFYGLAGKFSHLPIVMIIMLVFVIAVIVANLIIYIPWFAITVTANSSNPLSMWQLSFNIAKRYALTILTFLCIYVLATCILEVSFVGIKYISEYIRLGLLGDFIVDALILIKYAFVIIFSIVIYFSYISVLGNTEEIKDHSNESQYKDDYEIAKNVISQYYISLQKNNHYTVESSKVTYRNETTKEANVANQEASSKKSAKVNKTLGTTAPVDTTQVPNQNNEPEPMPTVNAAPTVKTKTKNGFFSRLFKKQEKQPANTFKRVENAQLQFDADKVDAPNAHTALDEDFMNLNKK